jgi:hypothetical protein
MTKKEKVSPVSFWRRETVFSNTLILFFFFRKTTDDLSRLMLKIVTDLTHECLSASSPQESKVTENLLRDNTTWATSEKKSESSRQTLFHKRRRRGLVLDSTVHSWFPRKKQSRAKEEWHCKCLSWATPNQSWYIHTDKHKHTNHYIPWECQLTWERIEGDLLYTSFSNP